MALLEGAVARGVLAEEGADEVEWAGVVVRGQRREERAEVARVVEVSWGGGPGDGERAVRRGGHLAPSRPAPGARAVAALAREVPATRPGTTTNGSGDSPGRARRAAVPLLPRPFLQQQMLSCTHHAYHTTHSISAQPTALRYDHRIQPYLGIGLCWCALADMDMRRFA